MKPKVKKITEQIKEQIDKFEKDNGEKPYKIVMCKALANKIVLEAEGNLALGLVFSATNALMMIYGIEVFYTPDVSISEIYVVDKNKFESILEHIKNFKKGGEKSEEKKEN